MVEIIPRPTPKVPFWLNILLYISVAGLLISILLLFSLIRFQKKDEETLQDLKDIIEQDRPEQEALEKEVFGAKEKIDDFAKLLNVHYTPLNFFELLEELCHPQIRFTEIKLNVGEAVVGLSGESRSFTALEQQLVILKSREEIKHVQLSKIAMGKEGGAIFALTLALDPGIFK